MFSVRFLSFAALVAVANACYDCYGGCYKCTYRGPSTTEPGYETVTIDGFDCKESNLSWMCCTGTSADGAGDCGVASGNCANENKCEGVTSVSYNVPSGSTTLYLQSHDGQANGRGDGSDLKNNEQSSICSAGTNVDPFAANTFGGDGACDNVVCEVTINLNSCPTGGPEPTGAGGDPHIKTWAGEWFDYSGECDLVLIEAPAFAQGLGLSVHIRTKARYDYSFISNAVLKIDDETFEVASYGDSLLNGVSGVDFPATIAGYPISYTMVNPNEHAFSVDIGREQFVRFRVFKDMVTVKFDGATESDFSGSNGLIGSFDTKHVASHNGTVLALENVDAIAAEWQVKTESVFASVRAPQYPESCGAPKMEKTNLRMAASAN